MDFAEVLEKVLELLQRQGRVSYERAEAAFNLDDVYLQDLKDELLFAYAEHVRGRRSGIGVGGQRQCQSLVSRVQSQKKSKVQGPKSKIRKPSPQSLVPSP